MTRIKEFKQKLQELEDLVENDKFSPLDEEAVLQLERDINTEINYQFPNKMELESLLKRINHIKMEMEFIDDDIDYDEDMYREMMQPDMDDDID